MRYTEIKFIDFLAGTDIKQAIEEAKQLAVNEDIIVKFRFNGISMRICSYSSVQRHIDDYHNRFDDKEGK